MGIRPVRVNGNATNSAATQSLVNKSSTGPRRPSLSTTLSHHPNQHNNNSVAFPLTPSTSSTSLNYNSTASSLGHQSHHYNSPSAGGGGSNGGVNVPRSYSREEMLNIFKLMSNAVLEKGMEDLLKRITNVEGTGGGKDVLTEVCWVENGAVVGPVGLEEMTAEEREVSSLGLSMSSRYRSQQLVADDISLHSSLLGTSIHHKSKPPLITTKTRCKVSEVTITITITIQIPVPLGHFARILQQWGQILLAIWAQILAPQYPSEIRPLVEAPVIHQMAIILFITSLQVLQ